MMFWKAITLSLLTIAAQSEKSNTPSSSSKGYRTVAYFVNWAIYGNFTPQDLPASHLTHILYAFADINPDTGEVFLTDARADIEKPLSGSSLDEPGNYLRGCLEQLYLLKKQNPALKVLLSIGGWTYSSHFALPASTSDGRSNFSASVVSLVKTYGLDGVDIDWEYPADASQGDHMVALFQAVRDAFDIYGNSLSPPYRFTLTAACPAPYGYQYLRFAEINQQIDFCNFMAYDYAGSWSTVAGDQSNLFRSSSNPESTPYNTEDIINYISASIPPDKIVLGIPLYGRAFNDTPGLGGKFSGSRTYDVKDLPLAGCVDVNDIATGSSHCYGSGELISYDTIPVVQLKAAFIQHKALGGAMFWESSMDGAGDKSVIQNVAAALGGEDGSSLDKTPNQLLYPDSPYSNILKCAPSTSSTATSPSTLPASTSCSVGSAFYNYQDLKVCTCGVDVKNKLLFYDPHALCSKPCCGAKNATTVCAKNEACMAYACTSGLAHCGLVIDGCQDFPRVIEMDFTANPVTTVI